MMLTLAEIEIILGWAGNVQSEWGSFALTPGFESSAWPEAEALTQKLTLEAKRLEHEEKQKGP